jgi:hypothetical protein
MSGALRAPKPLGRANNGQYILQYTYYIMCTPLATRSGAQTLLRLKIVFILVVSQHKYIFMVVDIAKDCSQ